MLFLVVVASYLSDSLLRDVHYDSHSVYFNFAELKGLQGEETANKQPRERLRKMVSPDLQQFVYIGQVALEILKTILMLLLERQHEKPGNVLNV